MRLNRRLTQVHQMYLEVIKRFLPRWMWKFEFVRSRATTLAYQLAAVSVPATANHVKEAWMAGWDKRGDAEKQRSQGRRLGMFEAISGMLLHSKNEGWEE